MENQKNNHVNSKTGDYEEIETSKFIPCVEVFLEFFIEIIGLTIIYFIFEWIVYLFIEKNDFNSDFLLSLVILPAVYVLKDFHQVFAPLFIKVLFNQENIIVKSGILTRREDSLELKNIENIELVFSPAGRWPIFSIWKKYYTLHLFAYGSEIVVPYVKSPLDLHEKIKQAKKNKIKD